MKKPLLLLLILFSRFTLNAQTPDHWSYVSVMYPHPDSMRIMATGFNIGSDGFIGLGCYPPTQYQDFYKITYAPGFNVDVWTPITNFPYPTYRALGFGIGNKGYVLTTYGASGNPSATLYSYDPVTDTWAYVGVFPANVRSEAVCFVLNNKAYICTGSDLVTGAALKEVWQYDPVTNQWDQKADFPGDGRLGAMGFAIGNNGYLGTGRLQSLIKLSDFWKYDPVSDTWTQLGNFPGGPWSYAVGMSIDGRGYLTTGETGGYESDLWEHHPQFDAWIQREPFPGFSRSYCAGFSTGTRGYVGTGIGPNQNTLWAYTPGNFATGPVAKFYNCEGETFNVEYISHNVNFQPGNIFNVELADAGLAFTNPIVIGSVTDTAAHGFIPVTIPTGMPQLMSYRIRVTASSPSMTAGVNSYYFMISPTPPQPTISVAGNIYTSSAATGNQWYDANGPIQGETGQQFTASSPGTYYVIVTESGCNSTPSSTVTSVNDIYNNSIAGISPNPFTDKITLTTAAKSTYVIYDGFGKNITDGSADGKTVLSLETLQSGIYFISVLENNSGRTHTEKLVKL